MNKTPTALYTTDQTDRLDAWEAEAERLIAEYNAKIKAWFAEIGKEEAVGIQRVGHRFITGYEDKNLAIPPLKGWRRTRENEDFCVPALRTKEGKAAEKRLAELQVRYAAAPGLPDRVWGLGYVGPMIARKLGGRWYAYTTVPLKHDVTAFGSTNFTEDGELKEVDTTIWTKAKLSDYFLALEAEETVAA
ncbi:hypothetical protein [Arthrobacter burdickii]|uniref:Uncharacterized protein n=1 Tax=Arthrobacter burdickii TaxID=3035920 RepID=A0ABT8K3A1_9MICC|nr:hypothetical protein [Arthrobacter burdickii]MDN4611921.1 hypothetical protein [Arthrobacter burdickii]